MSPEEKRKIKATKVEDGESGEATLLQLRAKLFALESKEAGWKERGVGSLKINVPKCCAGYDDSGAPLPGSFDISGLEDEDEDESTGTRVPRLIMRQENTHRVILNTVIVRAMEFKDKPSTSAAQIIFTAFEGGKESKPVQMLLRVSSPSAIHIIVYVDGTFRKFELPPLFSSTIVVNGTIRTFKFHSFARRMLVISFQVLVLARCIQLTSSSYPRAMPVFSSLK